MTVEKKKPGRPKNGPLVKVGPDIVDKTPQDMIDSEGHANSLLIQHEQNLAVIDRKFGDGLPYNFERSLIQVRHNLISSGMHFLEAGQALLQIKEHEDKGTFHIALERLNIAPRAAQKMMQVALKIYNKPVLAKLGSTKLLELILEDDEKLEALADGGTIAGLKLDDIDKMVVSELKPTLRKERERRAEEAEAHQMLLQKKDEKINRLDRDLMERTTRVKEWAGVVGEINENISRMSALVKMNLQHLHKQVDQILEEMERFDLSDEESSAIVEPFAIHIQTMFDHLNSLSASFSNNLSGYMPMHDVNYASMDHLEHKSDDEAAN